MVEVTCKYCKDKFNARQADINRGWAKFCSKSYKAKEQEKRTGQNRAYREYSDYESAMDCVEAGWDGHKS